MSAAKKEIVMVGSDAPELLSEEGRENTDLTCQKYKHPANNPCATRYQVRTKYLTILL